MAQAASGFRRSLCVAIVGLCATFAGRAGAFDNNKHVLIIGIDGCRSDALRTAIAPNIKGLADKGSVSWDAFAGGYPLPPTQQRTDSGPGWASILNGNWANNHLVASNNFANYNPAHPLFQTLKWTKSNAMLASIVEWPALDTSLIGANASAMSLQQVAANGQTTDLVGKVQNLFSYTVPDVLLVQFNEVNLAGQSSGFSAASAEYLAAISRVDAGVGEVVKAVQNRADYGAEDWLFVIVGVNGGDGTSQGGQTPGERTVFLVVSGNNTPKQIVSAGPAITCVPSTVMTFLTGPMTPGAFGWDSTTFGLNHKSISDNLAVYLDFDNNLSAQGGTTISGAPYKGTPKFTTGVLGQAAHFVNDQSPTGQPSDWAATLGYQDALYSGSFSVSAWVRMPYIQGLEGALLGNKDWTLGMNTGWVISEQANKNINWSDHTSRWDVNLTPTLQNTNWHHLVISWNRPNGVATTYFDGAVVNTGPTYGSYAAGLQTLIGASGNGIYAGNGDVDELGIWTRALSSAEAADLYRKAIDGVALATSYTPAAFITGQPISRSVGLGQTVHFQVLATGNEIAYQWRHDGTDIPGATSPTLWLTNVAVQAAGVYAVMLSNSGGSVMSSQATLTVTARPTNLNLTNGLVAHLTFDGNLLDSSGKGYDGTAVGNPTLVPGIVGDALQYMSAKDGSNFNYVTLGANIVKEMATNDYSMAFWFRHRNTSTANTYDAPILGNKNWNSGGNLGMVLAEQPSASWKYNATGSGSARLDVPGVRIGDGTWHHVTLTCARQGNISLYQDGVLVATQAAGSPGSILSGMPLNLGQDGAGSYTYSGQVGVTNAVIDDFGLWRRALSANEVASIQAEGIDGRSFDIQSPMITIQPHDIIARIHLGHTLLGLASGASPMAYQWFKDNQPIPGRTNSWWNNQDFQLGDAGSYFLQVSNRFGCVTSRVAVVTISSNDFGYPPLTVTNGFFTCVADQPLTIESNQVMALITSTAAGLMSFTLDAPVSIFGAGVAMTGNLGIQYTPPAGFLGDDFFFVNYDDGHGGRNASVITVTVTTNSAIQHVTAVDAHLVAVSGQPLGLSVSQILGLANDPLGQSLLYQLTSPNSQQGQGVGKTSFGTITYFPLLVLGSQGVPFEGEDQFQIQFFDKRGGVATATVHVTVLAAGSVPPPAPPQFVLHPPSGEGSNDIETVFRGGKSLVYVIEWAPSLDGPWTLLEEALTTPDGVVPMAFPVDRAIGMRFFRCRLAPLEQGN